jgi:transposase-like protein
MSKRRKFSPEKKVEILREILDNNLSITDAAEKYGVHPNVLSRWKKELFEGAVSTFNRKKEKASKKDDDKIEKLENIIRIRDGLIAELATENIVLKKNINGED